MHTFRCYRDDTAITHEQLFDRAFRWCMTAVWCVSLKLGAIEWSDSTLNGRNEQAEIGNKILLSKKQLTNSLAAHNSSCIESNKKVLMGVFKTFGLGGGRRTRATWKSNEYSGHENGIVQQSKLYGKLLSAALPHPNLSPLLRNRLVCSITCANDDMCINNIVERCVAWPRNRQCKCDSG